MFLPQAEKCHLAIHYCTSVGGHWPCTLARPAHFLVARASATLMRILESVSDRQPRDLSSDNTPSLAPDRLDDDHRLEMMANTFVVFLLKLS